MTDGFKRSFASLPTMERAALLAALQGWSSHMRMKRVRETIDEDIWRVIEQMVVVAESMHDEIDSYMKRTINCSNRA